MLRARSGLQLPSGSGGSPPRSGRFSTTATGSSKSGRLLMLGLAFLVVQQGKALRKRNKVSGHNSSEKRDSGPQTPAKHFPSVSQPSCGVGISTHPGLPCPAPPALSKACRLSPAPVECSAGWVLVHPPVAEGTLPGRPRTPMNPSLPWCSQSQPHSVVPGAEGKALSP